MNVKKTPFKISTALKDLIGRDLITEEFVAVFELVKNSFDAHARCVEILFDQNRIVIIDDGKGMSLDDILNKWLFVAYSAKRDGTEDDDYRHKLKGAQRAFAGAKGVGRFSCDRLGAQLCLYSQADQHPIHRLEIDWTLFEIDSKVEFHTVEARIAEIETFPSFAGKQKRGVGTILEITPLRSEWPRAKLQKLNRELMKLINPFSEQSATFNIEIVAPAQREQDDNDVRYNSKLRAGRESRTIVNGKVENPVLEVLRDRTTVIRVAVVNNGESIQSTLKDRGELIYEIIEPNPYPGLSDTEFLVDIYFLNRSAKLVFARRMGLPSVQFGSIFLFRNGFRVHPVGAEDDDFFGLNHRKQQGYRRFLGGRDLIGRVDIRAAKGFDEATSRNQGLIRTLEVKQMIDCVREKCVKRLERYVVDITWKDTYDKDTADLSRMKRDESSALVAHLVSRLAASDGVKLVNYNADLVRIVDEKSDAFEHSLRALEVLAERTGDKALVTRVDEAKARIGALEIAEREAIEATRRAENRAVDAQKIATKAELKYTEERKRNQFLVAAASLDQDTTLNLHHQIIMHASDVHLGVRRMMRKLKKGNKIAQQEWIDFLGRVSFRNSQILTASRFATKSGYKQQATEMVADLVGYIRDYIETVSTLWAPRGLEIEVRTDGKQFRRAFRPIEVGIVFDNLVSNAAKARARRLEIFTTVGKGAKPRLSVMIADDGIGWPQSLEPLEEVFEKGVTTTEGSGLGLYHVKQVVEALGGIVHVAREPYSQSLCGAHVKMEIPK